MRIHKPKSLSSVKALALWNSSSDGLPSWGTQKALPLNPRTQEQCLGKQKANLDAVVPLVCSKIKASNFSVKWSDLNKYYSPGGTVPSAVSQMFSFVCIYKCCVSVTLIVAYGQ